MGAIADAFDAAFPDNARADKNLARYAGSLIDAQITALAAASTALQIDVFAVGGQSNAVGNGQSANSPTPPADVKAWSPGTGTIVAGTDPFGGTAATGSMWPSFGIVYNKITRRPVLIVPAAAGSSAQTAAADTGAGHWDTGGTLRTNLVSQVNNAMTAAIAAGYSPKFCGVLWNQGETDASAIEAATITPSAYRFALQTMIAYFRTQFTSLSPYGARMPFYIWRLFGCGGHQNSPGWNAVRDGQEIIASVDLYTQIVYRAGRDFDDFGWNNGDLHANQAGLNHAGRYGALGVLMDGDYNGLAFYEGAYPLQERRTWVTDGKWIEGEADDGAAVKVNRALTPITT